ncbi:MAG TPA: hypothetical protein PKE51_00540 [Gemmatimonadaceae bacterium]|nr:hypothetical protein [Gemmatimonadaceae bacterium]
MEAQPSLRPSRCLLTLVNGRPDWEGRWWTAEDGIAVDYDDRWNKIPLSYRQIANNVSCDPIIHWLTTARATRSAEATAAPPDRRRDLPIDPVRPIFRGYAGSSLGTDPAASRRRHVWRTPRSHAALIAALRVAPTRW